MDRNKYLEIAKRYYSTNTMLPSDMVELIVEYCLDKGKEYSRIMELIRFSYEYNLTVNLALETIPYFNIKFCITFLSKVEDNRLILIF